MIRVGVAGAAGKVGRAVCEAVQATDDLSLSARIDPALNCSIEDVLADVDVVVDFTRPDAVVGNARVCVPAGVHLVIGTTAFSLDEMREVAEAGPGRVFFAPNFAIGAVLMMRFAAEASRVMQSAEIVEFHNPKKLDAPSGTAKRTAELMEGEVPIHSVRLPGVVADQEVVLGDVGQTLRITHVTTDRMAFTPGVLLAVRRVGSLPDPLTIGLDALL